MDIFAYGDSIGVGMFTGANYEWNKKDGTLALWTKKGEHSRDVLNVTTNRGVFVQTLDEDGNIIQEGGDGDWYYIRLSKAPIRLRYKALPDPDLTPKELNKARKTVTRYLVSDMPYSLKVPATLVGAIKWLEKKLPEIPEASRKKASVRFDTSMSYGETYPNLEITYEEPETDEEVVRRVQVERERRRLEEIKQRAQLDVLQSKFKPAKVH